MSSKNILEIKTEHAQQIKTLVEVLKEVLEDVNIEIKRDDIKEDEGYDSDSDEDSDSDTESDSESESDSEESESESEESESESGSEAESQSDDESDESEEESEKTSGKELSKEDLDKLRGYIRIMAVDPTKSIFIHLKLNSEKFRRFKCKQAKKNIGVNLIHLHKLIKSMDKDENLTLFIKNNDEQRLWIRRFNTVKIKDTIDNLNLIDLNKEKYKIPPTTFEAVVKMPSSEFHKVCKDMSSIADFVEIQCVNNKIVFKCKGDGSGRTVTYKHDELEDESDDEDDKKYKGCVRIKHSPSDPNKPLIVKEIFDLKNITLFNKFTQLCTAVQLYMKSDYPLVVKYTVATLGNILVCFTPVKLEERKFEDEHRLYNDTKHEQIN